MIAQEQARELIGSTAYDRSGSKLGKVGQVYLDGRNGRPEWITTKTGMFGTKESFVPLNDAKLNDGKVTVNFSKAKVQEAPRIDNDGELSSRDEESLYRHYGIDRGEPPVGNRAGPNAERTQSDTTRAGGTDDAMTRSEEQLHVGTEQREAGRARLRKYVVTEDEQVNVPVSHEEVRVEREPVTEENRAEALEGEPITEDEHEVTLHEERPTVSKETHPVERVRMEKDTVREEETVRDEVRKERIDAEGAENSESRRQSGRG